MSYPSALRRTHIDPSRSPLSPGSLALVRRPRIEPAVLKRVLVRRALPPRIRRWARRLRGAGQEARSARYCYAVWLRHLVRLSASGLNTNPTAVAELGPGASLGVGMAALLTGADRYVALDVVRHAEHHDNVKVFTELVDLLLARTPIPDATEFPEVRPDLTNFAFPRAVLDDDRLANCLAADRIAELGRRVRSGLMPYVTPWDDPSVIDPASVDLVLSQAVMEHVGNLDHTYAAIYEWLRPGGVMSHQIDFRSHGTSAAWNGHWRYSPRWWGVVRGDAPINREPLSRHLAAISQAGLKVIACDVEIRRDGLSRDELDPIWQGLSDEDLHAAGAYIQAVRPA